MYDQGLGVTARPAGAQRQGAVTQLVVEQLLGDDQDRKPCQVGCVGPIQLLDDGQAGGSEAPPQLLFADLALFQAEARSRVGGSAGSS